MRQTHKPRLVAAAVLMRPDGRVLLLRRSMLHQTNPGQWCFVTGYVKAGEEPGQAAVREVAEELGLEVEIERSGEIVVVETERGTLRVYPFLCLTDVEEVSLDWEHTDYTWIVPEMVRDYDIVPQLDEDLISLGLL
jgi:8-oxo-dGTP pyrophosphatase MutT (NUDIX family)